MIAYIPARGGSKRIPRKNIRSLGGRPVLGRTIDSLMRLPFIAKIYVSTDDSEIARVAVDCGATTLGLRPAELSNDKAGFGDLIRHDLPRHCADAGDDHEVLFVLATAALVPSSAYERAHAAYLKRQPELLMSCEPMRNSPYWALVPDAQGFLKPLFPDQVLRNSQDLPPAYADAGLFYMFNARVLARYECHKLASAIEPFVVDHDYAVDVDTLEDWQKLEEKFKQAGFDHG